jgi:hypothetical protein
MTDYIPVTNDHLTLRKDDIVYVMSKTSDVVPGWWEGEVNGVYGPFPPQNVKEANAQ